MNKIVENQEIDSDASISGDEDSSTSPTLKMTK